MRIKAGSGLTGLGTTNEISGPPDQQAQPLTDEELAKDLRELGVIWRGQQASFIAINAADRLDALHLTLERLQEPTEAVIDAAGVEFGEVHDKAATCNRKLVACTDAYDLAIACAIKAAAKAAADE